MSRAGSTGDGVTITLQAVDAGASSVLRAGAADVAAVGAAAKSAGGATDNLAKTAQKSIAQLMGPIGAATALAGAIMKVVQGYIDFENAAAGVGDANRAVTNSIMGSGGVATSLSAMQTELMRITKAADDARESINKMEREQSLADRFGEFVFGEGVNADAQRAAVDSAERQARAKAEAAELNRQAKEAADLRIQLEKEVAAQRKTGEAEVSFALRQEDQRHAERQTMIARFNGITFAERQRLADLEHARHTQAISDIQERERKELDSLNKLAEADRQRRDKQLQADRQRFEKGLDDQRKLYDAQAGLWAGLPDFFSAAQADLSMDLLTRIGR